MGIKWANGFESAVKTTKCYTKVRDCYYVNTGKACDSVTFTPFSYGCKSSQGKVAPPAPAPPTSLSRLLSSCLSSLFVHTLVTPALNRAYGNVAQGRRREGICPGPFLLLHRSNIKLSTNRNIMLGFERTSSSVGLLASNPAVQSLTDLWPSASHSWLPFPPV